MSSIFFYDIPEVKGCYKIDLCKFPNIRSYVAKFSSSIYIFYSVSGSYYIWFREFNVNSHQALEKGKIYDK